MPSMDLNTLAATLRAQAAANSTITLDSSVFSDEAVRAAIRSAFALGAGKDLTISNVPVESVPEPTNGELTISGGKASVLKHDALINVTFKSANGGLQAIVVAGMPKEWTFKDSFKNLDRFPFKDIKTTDARFVYTTNAQSEYAWPGEESTKIKLEQGLNFLAHVTFTQLAT